MFKYNWCLKKKRIKKKISDFLKKKKMQMAGLSWDQRTRTFGDGPAWTSIGLRSSPGDSNGRKG